MLDRWSSVVREPTGVVYKIKELAVHDGPGIRTTVFMKGCPLRCSWCHNPEGLTETPVVMRGPRERIVGIKYTSGELAEVILEHEDFLRQNRGGVTFSGGEPLQNHAFLAEVIEALDGRVHVAVDTCGYAGNGAFRRIADMADLILYDLKIMDERLHIRFTGKSNKPILRNLETAFEMEKKLLIRVPLIPEITDTIENLSAIASFLSRFDGPVQVELLPYNKAAGAKYELIGMEYDPGFDETVPVNPNLAVFAEKNIGATVR